MTAKWRVGSFQITFSENVELEISIVDEDTGQRNCSGIMLRTLSSCHNFMILHCWASTGTFGIYKMKNFIVGIMNFGIKP